MKIKSNTKRNYEDDGMLPLVNIIFLLLIFFMIVGVIEKNVVKENIQLPTATLDKFNNKELAKYDRADIYERNKVIKKEINNLTEEIQFIESCDLVEKTL